MRHVLVIRKTTDEEEVERLLVFNFRSGAWFMKHFPVAKYFLDGEHPSLAYFRVLLRKRQDNWWVGCGNVNKKTKSRIYSRL